MSAPIRFLGLAIVAYVGLRTASSALALEPAGAPGTAPAKVAAAAANDGTLPPGVAADMGPPTGEFGPSPQAAGNFYGPPPGAAYPYGGSPYAAAYGAPYPYMAAGAPAPYPPYPAMMAARLSAPQAARTVYYPLPYAVPGTYGPAPAPPAPQPAMAAAFDGGGGAAAGEGYGQPVPALDQWPAIGTAGPYSFGTATQVTPGWEKRRGKRREIVPSGAAERWSVDGWALLRPPREGVYRLDDPDAGLNPGLASAGSLGGSQAGLRITWRPLSSIGVHLRASSALIPRGRSAQNQQMIGGEAAAGVSWQPLRSLPVRLLAERRQRLGPALGGGRDAFALMAEGGLYSQPLPYGVMLDGYGQAGVVGANRRDLFADGALTATYPFMPRFAVGAGMWGGIQPGLSRFDAGPRLSYQLRPGLRAHLDYRFRVTGNADPRSGPALTLAAGF